MSSIEHPNFLKSHACFTNEENLWIVMPLMDMGSCLHVLRAFKSAGLGEGMKEEWIRAILSQVVEGLKYAHQRGFIHRDLKAGNILLDSSGLVKIADFGVSGWLEAGARKKLLTFVGTPCWMAPEVMEQVKGYETSADVWSLGITALELAKGYVRACRWCTRGKRGLVLAQWNK